MGHHGIAKKNKGTHYYLTEAMPLVLCGACLMVVLASSEKARGIYNKIVESYRLPDIRAAFSELEAELSSDKIVVLWEENIEDLRMRHPENRGGVKPLLPDADFYRRLNKMTSRYSHVFSEWFDLEGDKVLSVDFRYWLGLIEELVSVGFNNEAEQARGIYKVTPATSPRLVFAIHLSAFARHNRVGIVDDDERKAVSIYGRSYDLRGLLADKSTDRDRRNWTKAYKKAGYKLWDDDRIVRIAVTWYQCRVVCSGPEEFCREMFRQNIAVRDASNVSNEIKDCDYAVGYPRGRRATLV